MKFVFINSPRIFAKNNIWRLINGITPPIGLALLAAILERAGYDADIIDAFAEGLSSSEIMERISPNVDFIGFTATTPEINNVLALASSARKRFPDAKILMGGVHSTIFHEKLVSDGLCDLVIRGEGEEAILELAAGKPLETVKNLTWRTGQGETIVNEMSSTFVNLERLPSPAYHKLPMGRYHSALGAARMEPSLGLITSRGCPGSCTFCFSGMFGKKVRYQSAEKIFSEMVFLRKKYGIREFSFYDDTFTADRKRVEDLCGLILAENLKISWSCFARVDAVNGKILKLMKQAGCHQIMFGFESADEEVLKTINKKTGLKAAENAVALTREAGINVRGAFMLGNPGETAESMSETIRYACRLPIQYAIFNITTPFPGTKMYDWAKRENLLHHENWEEYDFAHPILKMEGLSPNLVGKFYKAAFREFYLRPSYVFRKLFERRTKFESRLYLRIFLNLLPRALSFIFS